MMQKLDTSKEIEAQIIIEHWISTAGYCQKPKLKCFAWTTSFYFFYSASTFQVFPKNSRVRSIPSLQRPSYLFFSQPAPEMAPVSEHMPRWVLTSLNFELERGGGEGEGKKGRGGEGKGREEKESRGGGRREKGGREGTEGEGGEGFCGPVQEFPAWLYNTFHRWDETDLDKSLECCCFLIIHPL